jgi:hypothetical protein
LVAYARGETRYIPVAQYATRLATGCGSPEVVSQVMSEAAGVAVVLGVCGRADVAIVGVEVRDDDGVGVGVTGTRVGTTTNGVKLGSRPALGAPRAASHSTAMITAEMIATTITPRISRRVRALASIRPSVIARCRVQQQSRSGAG